MAYSDPAVTKAARNGRRVVISGESIAAGTEVKIPDVPRSGTIRRVKSRVSAGTASNIRPQITISAGGSGNDVVYQAPAAAGLAVDEQPDSYYHAPGGELWYKGVPDAGSDNTEDVELLIADGWVS